MARSDKSIDIAIRGRDEYSRVLKKAEKDLTGFAAAQARTQARRNILADNLKGVRETRAELAKARKEATDLGKILYGRGAAPRGFDTVSGLENLEAAKAKVQQLEGALQSYNATLNTLRNKQGSGFAAFSKTATALEDQAAASRAATAAQNAQTDSGKRLEMQLNRVADASRRASMKRVAINESIAGARERARNMGGMQPRSSIFNRITSAWATQDGRGPLGLRPYELTNLSYQINDVISGLAMGQPPMQVFAQQAGQIAQIFPKFIAGFLRLSPVIAVLTPFAIALARVNREANLIKDIELEFSINVDADQFNPRLIANMVEAADKAGLSFEDAKSSVMALVRADFSSSQIPGLIDMAQRLARVTGTDVPTAVDTLVKGFSNGVEGVLELDKQFNFLTASQYQNIVALEKQGRTADAVKMAMGALEDQLADVSAKSGGAWASAARDLGDAWNTFIDYLADTDTVRLMADALGILAKGVKSLTGALRAAQNVGDTLTDGMIGATDAQMAELQARAQARSQYVGGAKYWTKELLFSRAPGYDLESDRLRAQEDMIIADAVTSLPQSMRTAENVAWIETAVRAGEALEDVFAEIGARVEDTADAGDGVTEQTERQKKAALDIHAKVVETVAEMDEEARLASLTAKERFIELKTLELRNELLKEGKELTAEQLAMIRQSAEGLYNAQNPLGADFYEAQFTANRFSPKGQQQAELVKAATMLAEQMGLKVEDILTAISYETAGTFDPWKAGPTTQHGQHRGLIQWGEPQRARYGVTESMSIGAQVAAIGRYLQDTGVKSGDGLLQIYAAINAGNARKIHASDANNGGAPGTVLDKVNGQMEGHRAKAQGMVAAYGGQVREAEDQFKAQEKADEFHAEMAQSIEMQRQENALLNENIIARETAKALALAENAAKKAGTELEVEERAAIIENIRLKYADAAAEEAKNKRLEEGKKLQDAVNLLVEKRALLQQQLDAANESGDVSAAQQLTQEMQALNVELDAAIQKATAFWSSMEGGEGAVVQLQKTKLELADTNQTSQITAQSINNLFEGAIANGLNAYARAVAEGKSQVTALKEGFAQAASEILIGLGQMIIKQALFNAISGAGGGVGGGIGGKVAGFINTAIFHNGGMASNPTQFRSFSLQSIANAPRFHNGTPNNLRPNEMVAVLERDEEVLTSDDPRHADNIRQGGGMGAAPNIINAIDGSSFLEQALATSQGENILLNYIRANADTIGNIVGRN